MKATKQQMKLGAFLYGFGHHFAAWRHPLSGAKSVIDLEHYKQAALAAERGKLDMLFLADSSSLPNLEDAATNVSFLYPDAATVITALSAITENVGLAATVSTTFHEPYNLARRFATLDHLSKGRAAWNVVTGTKTAEARNFNRDGLMEHGVRYERAQEFIDVVTGLWDSWEDEALIFDKSSGHFADTSRIHALNHKGAAFSVAGPLNIPRSPQGRPVIIQAGTSPTGQRLAARTAEVVFTACEDKSEAIAFYQSIKSLLAGYGRSADDLKVMPGILPFIGSTEAEARRLEEEFNELVLPEAGVTNLSRMLNVDVSGYPIDGPLPEMDMGGNTSRAVMIHEMARTQGMTIRQLSRHFSVARGHLTVTGTPEKIADKLQEWFTEKACDGFNVMPPYLPGGLDTFVDEVVPILRKRGSFRTDYEGSTLRENLGLTRPVSRFSAAAQAQHE